MNRINNVLIYLLKYELYCKHKTIVLISKISPFVLFYSKNT